uniref:Uncharacterized protein n=1 Tax=Anopheles culicifacies TaxID=139723 RepID=A0A182LX72_9DIPT
MGKFENQAELVPKGCNKNLNQFRRVGVIEPSGAVRNRPEPSGTVLSRLEPSGTIGIVENQILQIVDPVIEETRKVKSGKKKKKANVSVHTILTVPTVLTIPMVPDGSDGSGRFQEEPTIPFPRNRNWNDTGWNRIGMVGPFQGTHH